MTTKSLRLFIAAWLLAGTSFLRAAIAPAENLLPADTLGFFTVPDFSALRAAGKTSPQMMFWNDPAMKPFRDKLVSKFTEQFIAPLEKDLGVKLDDFTGLPQGQLTVGVTVNGSNGHDDVPPGYVLLLDARDKSDLLETNLAKLTKKWNDAGRALRTETIHGLAFTVVPLSSNDFSAILPHRPPVSEIGKEPKPEKPGEIYFARYKSLLIAGNSAKVMDTIAAHLTGGGAPAIASDANFAADKLSQFRDSPLYYGWFNASKFFTVLAGSSSADQDDSDAPSFMPRLDPAKILAATGLDKLKSASFVMRDKPDGSTATVHLSVSEGARTGLLKMLALPSKDASIPVFVPADATKFTRIRLDGKQLWAELQKMVGAITPQALASLNAVIDMANTFAKQKNPGFDLRTYLFDNLGDDIITYQKPPVGDTLADMSNPPTLVLIGVSNPDQAIDGLRTVLSLGAPQDGAPAPRDFRGHKIYSIAQRKGRSISADDNAAPSYLYLASNSGYVAMSKNSSILEEYLRSADGKTKPLRETPGITAAAAHVGGMNGGLFSYENQRETMRAAFKVMKNAGDDGASMLMLPPSVRDWVDFSLLPDYDAVAKYFYITVLGAGSSSSGITLNVYSPRPPQLN